MSTSILLSVVFHFCCEHLYEHLKGLKGNTALCEHLNGDVALLWSELRDKSCVYFIFVVFIILELILT